jgi:hypothetical protein
MGLLYQDIMKVPGLTGTAAQRQKQLYEKLGSPKGPYTGSKDQNLFLLSKVPEAMKGSAAPAAQPAPAAQAAPAAGNDVTKQFVESIIGSIKKQEPYPPFTWSDKQEKDALAYAEKVYGPYFADILKQYTENADIARTRLDEDTKLRLKDISDAVTDYTNKSQIEQQRLSEDYKRARDAEARNLGINLEEISLAKERGEEDTDRTLAELQVDYERTGGRISTDKAKNLSRLLEEKQAQGMQIDTTESRMLEDIKRNYGELLNQTTETAAQKGLTFSGLRTKEEAKVKDEADRLATRTGEDALTQRTNLERNYGYTADDIVEQAKRNLDDITTQYERSTGGVQRSYERNLADLTRNEKITKEQSAIAQENLQLSRDRGEVDINTDRSINLRELGKDQKSTQLSQSRGLQDIQRQLEQDQKRIEEEKQRQIETGYFGAGEQKSREEESYYRRLGNYDAASLAQV